MRQSHGAQHALTPSSSRRIVTGGLLVSLVALMLLVLSATGGSPEGINRFSAFPAGTTATTQDSRVPAVNAIAAGNAAIARAGRYAGAVLLHQYIEGVEQHNARVGAVWKAVAAQQASTNHGYDAAPVYSGSNMGGFLNCVRQRESTGDYSVVNSTGHAGAYQFAQSTWDATARHIGRLDLVGVRPNQAAPAVQDMMAQALYAWQGKSPWDNPGGKQC